MRTQYQYHCVSSGRAVHEPREQALSADRPVVLEAIVDPDVPPLPPHIGFDQAAAMSKALLKGDPDAAGVIRQSLRELVAGIRPERGVHRW